MEQFIGSEGLPTLDSEFVNEIKHDFGHAESDLRCTSRGHYHQ